VADDAGRSEDTDRSLGEPFGGCESKRLGQFNDEIGSVAEGDVCAFSFVEHGRDSMLTERPRQADNDADITSERFSY
jgi:hypothetical protein